MRTLLSAIATSALRQKETNGIAAIYIPSRADLALRTRKTENLLWTNCSSFYPGIEECASLSLRARRGLAVASWSHQALQPLLTARTSDDRRTSPMKLASKGEILSLRHARASRRVTLKSTTGKMITVAGHRQRAVARTHPTPKPVDTRLRIVASFSPS
jgi:hypothetical protein